MANWNFVDANIQKAVTPQTTERAFTRGIESRNTYARNYNYSLLAAAKIPKPVFDSMRLKIVQGMQTDPDKYVRLRAACLLAEHGPGKYSQEVVKILERHRNDPEEDAKIAAVKYLRRLNRKASP